MSPGATKLDIYIPNPFGDVLHGVFYTMLFFDEKLNCNLWLSAHMKSIRVTFGSHVVLLKSDVTLFPADVYYNPYI